MICYKEHVVEFVAKFKTHQREIEELIDHDDFTSANKIVQEMLDSVLPGLPFRLAKDNEKSKYILEFMTAFDPIRRILAFYFCDKLSEQCKKSWKFYYYHPALKGSFSKDGITFYPEEIYLIPTFDNKRHHFNLKVVKDDKFKVFSEEDCFLILYMLLSDALGGTAVEAYLGSIQFLDRVGQLWTYGKERIRLSEFSTLFQKECRERNWIDPEEITFIAENYSTRTKKFNLRQDITEGISFCLDLLNEEGIETEKQHALNFIRTAAVGLYSVVENVAPSLSRKEKKAKRELIEKEINRIVSETKTGMLVNSAMGNAHNYVDFLAYDELTLIKIAGWVSSQPGLELVEIN